MKTKGTTKTSDYSYDPTLKKNKSKGNMDNFMDIVGFMDNYIKDIFYEKKFKFQKLFNEILKFLEIRLF